MWCIEWVGRISFLSYLVISFDWVESCATKCRIETLSMFVGFGLGKKCIWLFFLWMEHVIGLHVLCRAFVLDNQILTVYFSLYVVVCDMYRFYVLLGCIHRILVGFVLVRKAILCLYSVQYLAQHCLICIELLFLLFIIYSHNTLYLFPHWFIISPTPSSPPPSSHWSRQSIIYRSWMILT